MESTIDSLITSCETSILVLEIASRFVTHLSGDFMSQWHTSVIHRSSSEVSAYQLLRLPFLKHEPYSISMANQTNPVSTPCGISTLILEILLLLLTHLSKRLHVSMVDDIVSLIRLHGSSMLVLGMIPYLYHHCSISRQHTIPLLSPRHRLAASCFSISLSANLFHVSE